MKIAVLIPCYNEEITIYDVVQGFKRELNDAEIYVYDNDSTDETKKEAARSGAIVRTVSDKGKGNVVRRMFAEIDADYYVLVDGDMTYDPKVISGYIDYTVSNGLDMLNISRIGGSGAFRSFHRFGNFFLSTIISTLFGKKFRDVLSGYRVFSKKFVKSFPAKSQGFEVESELTIHSLDMNLPVSELEAAYIQRPDESKSKLSTYVDGVKILAMILKLLFQIRPLFAFSALSVISLLLGLLVGWYQVILPLFESGVIERYPSVVLAASLVIISILLFVSGLVINSISMARRDILRLVYLNVK